MMAIEETPQPLVRWPQANKKTVGMQSAKTGAGKEISLPPVRDYKKLVLAGIILLLCLGIIAGVLLAVLLPTSEAEINYCAFGGTPTEFEILNCERQLAGVKCDFDISSCQSGCVLSYEQDEYGCFKSCSCALGGVLESDIAFSQQTIKSMMTSRITEEDSSYEHSSVSIHQPIWDWMVVNERVRVPYVIAPSLKGKMERIDAIKEAIELFSASTCVDFVPHTGQDDTEQRHFVEFIAELNGCRSNVGRIGGRQYINLSKKCIYAGIVVHLMMHTLGFWHEQSNPMRDDFVTVNYENISPGHKFNFKPLGSGAVRDINSTYSLTSLMHFDGLSFSHNHNPTIVDKTGATVKAQRNGFTKQNIDDINTLYICLINPFFKQNQAGDYWSEWGSFGICSATCGVGQKARMRECLSKNDTIVYKSRCPGANFVLEECESEVECEEGIWGPWSPCSTTCNKGTRFRKTCCLPNIKYEAMDCVEKKCDETGVFGNWLEWTAWGPCSRSCGSGWRRRTRGCKNHFWEDTYVRQCPWQLPSSQDLEQCQTMPCDSIVLLFDTFGWSEWGEWQTCSKTCGKGIKMRYRTCPTDAICEGFNDDMDVCHLGNCPSTNTTKNITRSIWGKWSTWSVCTDDCGQTQRSRVCYKNGYEISDQCVGMESQSSKETETRICARENCKTPASPVGGTATWTEWTAWSLCKEECEIKERTRNCLKGMVLSTACDGFKEEKQACNTNLCFPQSESVILEVQGKDFDDVPIDDDANQVPTEYQDLVPEIRGDWTVASSAICQEGWKRTLDANGDGATDVICIAELKKVVLQINNRDGTFGTLPIVYASFCKFGVGNLVLGDFDGDFSEDVLCFDRDKKVARVTWRTNDSYLHATAHDISTGDFCVDPNAELQVHHMNDDLKSDLLCVFSDGRIVMMLNQWPRGV